MIARVRAAWCRWQVRRLVARLNRQAAFFGVGPFSEAEWIDVMRHLVHIAPQTGVTAAQAADALRAVGAALRGENPARTTPPA